MQTALFITSRNITALAKGLGLLLFFVFVYFLYAFGLGVPHAEASHGTYPSCAWYHSIETQPWQPRGAYWSTSIQYPGDGQNYYGWLALNPNGATQCRKMWSGQAIGTWFAPSGTWFENIGPMTSNCSDSSWCTPPPNGRFVRQFECSYPDGWVASTGVCDASPTAPPPPAPAVDIWVNPGSVSYGGYTTYSWSSSYAQGESYYYCRFYINGAYVGQTPSWPFDNAGWADGPLYADKTYTIQCTDAWGNSSSDTVRVDIAPIVTVDSVSSGTYPSCGYVSGWTFDPSRPTDSIRAHMYTLVPWQGWDRPTDVTRNDVNAAYGITGVHGFGYQMPLAGPGNYTSRVHGIGINNLGVQNGINPYVDTAFSCMNPLPTVNNVTINPMTAIPDGVTNHTITMTASDPLGGNNIRQEYALVNYQGANGGVYRGYPTWSIANSWPSAKNNQACAGGGYAAIQPNYGDTYMTLVSCSTSVAGNVRTVNFVVRFNSTYTTPTTANDISGYACDDAGACAGWVNYDINFTLQSHALTVTKAGSVGAGTVTSNPAGINCGADCNESYVYGQSVTVTAPAAAGHSVAITGACTANGAVGVGASCAVSMTQARGVTVTYTPTTYAVTYNAGTATGGAVPANQTKTHGTDLTLQANTGNLTRTGYTFAGWDTAADGSGTDYASGGAYSANAAVTLYPRWTINSYTLTVAKNGGGSGTVTATNPAQINCGADCSEIYAFGTMVQLSASGAGSSFTGWSGGGCSGTGTCTVTMTGPLTVTATFAVLPDLSSINVTPASGTVISSSGSANFTGTAQNSAAAAVGQGGWADVEIDWSTDGSFDNLNAYSGNQLGAFAQSGSKALSYSYNNPPIGSHRYRFNVDTTNVLAESNEVNNRSAWVPFTVASGSINAAPDTLDYGATTTITWDSQGTGALTCTVTGGSDTWNGGSGTQEKTLFGNTNYTLSCNGTALATVSVTVDMTPVLTSTSTRVDAGSVIRLNYDTKGQVCTLTAPGQGQVTGVGYVDVTVYAMTTYRLLCPDANNEARLRIEITPRIIET